MKSAYELAMERLNAESPNPQPSLSDAQKAELSEIDKKFQAKIAERDVFLKKQLEEARMTGDRAAESEILTQIRHERERLNDEMEVEKNAVRSR